jgi:hypothetical protein
MPPTQRQPGSIVQVQDRDRIASDYQYAVVACPATKGEATFGNDKTPGYVITYLGTGDQVWRSDWDVLNPRDKRIALVRQATTAIAGSGHATTLQSGAYRVAELDATDGELFLHLADNTLIKANPKDPNIHVLETGQIIQPHTPLDREGPR